MQNKSSESALDSQLEKLKRLIEIENFDILEIQFSFNSEVNKGESKLFAQVEIEKGSSRFKIHSTTSDFFQYCFHLQKSLDDKGEEQFKKLKDPSRYQQQLVELTTNQDQKRHQAFERLTSKGLSDDINLYKLFKQYLKTRQWHDSQFTPLKDYYFETQVLFIDLLRAANASSKKIEVNQPRSQKYYHQIDKLLTQAFRDKDNFVKSAVHFSEVAMLDLDYLYAQAESQHTHMIDTINMLANRNPLETTRSLKHLLNFYRVHAEWAAPFIKVLSNAVTIINGDPLPDPNMGYRKRCEIIRSSTYKDIVKCLDPEIRHGESHLTSVIDSSDMSITISEQNDHGDRFTKVRYEFDDFVEMSSELIHGLFYALLSAFAVHEYTLASQVVLSKHYLLALLTIDQID